MGENVPHEPELFEVRQVKPDPEGDMPEAIPCTYYVRCGCGEWLVDRDRDRAIKALTDHATGIPMGVGTGTPSIGRSLPDAFGGVLVMTITDAAEHDALAESLSELVRTSGASAGVILVEGEQLEVHTHDEVVRILAQALGDGDLTDPGTYEAWLHVAERALPRLGRLGWALAPTGAEYVSDQHTRAQ